MLKTRFHWSIFLVSTLFLLGSGVDASAELTKQEMGKLLSELDERARSMGDYKAVVYMEQKKKGQPDLVYQGVTYRREAEEKFIFLFTKPKTEAGKGYLRIDRNLFLYDPSAGRWERRTERARIGGTDSRRQDFDVKNLARDYEPSYAGEDKLGKFEVHHLRLKAKKEAKVPFPVMEVWLDKETNNILKQQDFASSGKLLRTLYFPSWEKVFSKKKKGHVHFPREIRIFDELDKGAQTIIVLQKVVVEDLPDNVFTKAWLQRRSR